MNPATGFQIHLLRFRASVVTPLQLPRAAGAALRGALFGALRGQFCLAGRSPECGHGPVSANCPVCFLLAPVDESSAYGRDVPRPYVLRVPPSTPLAYAAGEQFEFSLATFGRALNYFPYALLGIDEVGRQGLGVGRRGTFRVDEVWAENPLTAGREPVYQRAQAPLVHAPAVAVDATHVEAEAVRLAAAGADRRVRIQLLTPTRLIASGQLVKPGTFSLGVLVARLLERLTALFGRYASTGLACDAPALVRAAHQVRVVQAELAWQELFRASARHRRMTPMSGLVGSVVVEGGLAPFLPWLVWGTLTHVGKDAAMGNGMLQLEPA
jgi:CRISPR-associated endoribonuclease Cas6